MTTINAASLRVGDTIAINSMPVRIQFVALYRGVQIEIKYKSTSLWSRTLPEQRIVVAKNKTFEKI